MISKPVEKLLKELVDKVGYDKDKIAVKRNPEKYLTAILLNINEEITRVSAMLESTVTSSFFHSRLEEADQLLRGRKNRRVNRKRKSVLSATR